MLAEKRHRIILNMLNEQKILKLKDIVMATSCSESSVRRDLKYLEQQGKLVRVHGGAKLKHHYVDELDMLGKSTQNVEAKKAIARRAVSQIQDGDVIYLDSGTSTLAMIPFLSQKNNLTVVTNGVEHASILADKSVKTYLIGGVLKNTTKAIVGTTALEQLERFRFNKTFLGINGVDCEYQLTTPDPDEADIKRLAVAHAEKSYVLADNSKFGKIAFAKVVALDSTVIITTTLPHDIKKRFAGKAQIQEVTI